MMPAFAFEIEDRVDHMLDDARACDLAFLGNVADKHDGRAGRLRVTDEGLGGRPDLGDRAGCRFGKVGPQGLDRIEDDEVRLAAFRERCEDVLDIGLRRQFNGRAGNAETLGTKAHLRHGLLPGYVDDAVPIARKGSGSLHEQRRLANAGIAADQNRRTAHETATGRPVEFADAGGNAWRILDIARKSGQGDDTPLAPAAHALGTAAYAAGRAFLD